MLGVLVVTKLTQKHNTAARSFSDCTSGYPRRNVRDFGRVFLMLNHTDITQNTYVQSRTVMEIMAREKYGRHRCRNSVRRP